MTKKLMMVAACLTTVLLGSGVAQAAPPPAPDPDGPKCWVTSDDGHNQLTPCGWAYSAASGWYQVPYGTPLYVTFPTPTPAS
jgi:hypothetical protein